MVKGFGQIAKQLLAVIALQVLAANVYSQDAGKVANLFYYNKLWNFVKYYHPAMASGTLNADSIYFEGLRQLDKVNSYKEFNGFVKGYLIKLDDVKPITVSAAVGQASANKPKFEIADSLKIARISQNFAWYQQGSFFSKANFERLNRILKNRWKNEKHYYLPERNFDAVIPNEPEYKLADTAVVSYELRMLSLAKMLGVVDYLYPHRHQMDKNFDALMMTAIPKMMIAENRESYETILMHLAASFNDTHSSSFPGGLKYRRKIFQNLYYPPFTYAIVDRSIIVTGYVDSSACAVAGLKTGDEIIAYNGRSVGEHIERLSDMIPSSNRPTLLLHLSDYRSNYAWQTPLQKVQLTVGVDAGSKTVEINFIDPLNKESNKMLVDHIISKQRKPRTTGGLDTIAGGVVYFKINETARFYEGIADENIDAHVDSLLSIAEKSKALIFDMRGYPDWGGFVYTYILKKFGKTPNEFAHYYENNKQAVGKYIFKPETEVYHNSSVNVNNEVFKGKVVIIVDPETLSQSEFNTMSLQHIFPQSITVGEQSAGADGDEKIMKLPGGYKLKFTGNIVCYPDGTVAQRNGVRISKKIPLTKDAVLSKNDKLLEEAIRIASAQ